MEQRNILKKGGEMSAENRSWLKQLSQLELTKTKLLEINIIKLDLIYSSLLDNRMLLNVCIIDYSNHFTGAHLLRNS